MPGDTLISYTSNKTETHDVTAVTGRSQTEDLPPSQPRVHHTPAEQPHAPVALSLHVTVVTTSYDSCHQTVTSTSFGKRDNAIYIDLVKTFSENSILFSNAKANIKYRSFLALLLTAGKYFLSFNELPSSSALILPSTFREICFITSSFKSSLVTCHFIRQVMQVLTVQILCSSQAVLVRPA